MSLMACASSPKGRDGVDVHRPVVADEARYNKGNLKPYTVRGRTYQPVIPKVGHEETGTASWYGHESPNRHTADGEVFVADGISAAHKTFPLPSIAEVTNLDNGKTIRVRVNDRGPFSNGRIIDLSRGAAKALGVYTTGTAKVRVKFLGPAEPLTASLVHAVPSDDRQSYIVQLGAFSQRDNAERVRDKIDDAHVDRRGDIYIVYIGPYMGAASAEKHRQKAIDAGFTGAILKRAD
ncbi:SPOR domain-containing protein [Asticcacaulis biprosthecium]|uniref:SPOR domain-containing protein n=1 Tax=Asticcacaulis biprosthecium TaxID=76891 RepID=UPI00058CD919|nr:SPOR domain-containing protein [Asticcacaulis biprosthecium]